MIRTLFTHPSWRRPTLPQVVWGAGGLLIVVMSVLQVYDVLKRLDIVMESAQREVGSTVRLLAEQTAGSIQAVDAVVREAAASADLQLAPQDGRLPKRLRDRISRLEQVRDLALVRLDGAEAAQTSSGAIDQPLPPAVQAQLRKLQGNGTGDLQVSDAFYLPGVGAWTLALSRPWMSSDGHGRGLVVAYLDLEHYRRFYAGLAPPPGSHLYLLGRDAQLLVEQPTDTATTASAFASQPVFRALLQSSQGVGKLLVDPGDGSKRIYAVEAVPGFPLAVGLSSAKAAVLAPWYVQAMHSAARTTSLCASVALLMWLVLRQLRRREQAEARLRVQTASLDELIESAPEAIAMLDLKGRIARVNREFTRLFGYSLDQARGQTLEALIVPPELQQESQRMALAVTEGKHVSTETERQRSDGSRIAVSALSAPIVAATGPIASYAIYRDITERVYAENERAKLESRLYQAEKLEALGTMAGGIAHDFNSILSAIQGYGNLALASTLEAATAKRYVTNILSAAERGRGLVEQILTYSRSTRGRRVLVNIAGVVSDTLELVRASLPADIELHARLEAREGTVMADPTHIHQLVMNLCSNAVHSMEKGGTLEVDIDQLDSAGDVVVSHGSLTAMRYVVLRVRDTGRGMPAAILDRIFEPFYTTGHAGGGTGLGLALVYAIMTELGGAIDVQTSEGVGSQFTLYLPAAEAQGLEAVSDEAALPRGQGEHVMLVEDEQGLMLLQEEMLAALNYEPAGFTRPTDALAEFTADPSRFDIVVLDQFMPDLTGLELAKRMRAVRDALPIILVTGYRGPLLDQEARAAGVDHILPKPLDFRRLAEALHAALAAAVDRPVAG